MHDTTRPATGAPQALAWPLVGRGAELERIARARDRGAGPGVVLSAAAGIGKSRLARDAVQAAEQDGALGELGPRDAQRGGRPARRVRRR